MNTHYPQIDTGVSSTPFQNPLEKVQEGHHHAAKAAKVDDAMNPLPEVAGRLLVDA